MRASFKWTPHNIISFPRSLLILAVPSPLFHRDLDGVIRSVVLSGFSYSMMRVHNCKTKIGGECVNSNPTATFRKSRSGSSNGCKYSTCKQVLVLIEVIRSFFGRFIAGRSLFVRFVLLLSLSLSSDTIFIHHQQRLGWNGDLVLT